MKTHIRILTTLAASLLLSLGSQSASGAMILQEDFDDVSDWTLGSSGVGSPTANITFTSTSGVLGGTGNVVALSPFGGNASFQSFATKQLTGHDIVVKEPGAT